MNNFVVYKHRNTINDKVYIGITSQKPEARWNKGRGYKMNKHFYRAIQQYGWDNFEHTILRDNLPEQCARTLEKLYIAIYQSTDPAKGYNFSKGGEASSGRCGKDHPLYGRKLTDEHKKKLSESHIGHKTSEITLAKKSKSMKGKNTKHILKYDLNGVLVETFSSIKAAVASVNGNYSHFKRDLSPNGEYKGYVWKYEASVD